MAFFYVFGDVQYENKTLYFQNLVIALVKIWFSFFLLYVKTINRLNKMHYIFLKIHKNQI